MMPHDDEPVSFEEMAHVLAIDEQIDQRLHAGAAAQANPPAPLEQPFIQELHDFHQPKATAIHQTLERVWARLEQRGASATQPGQPQEVQAPGSPDGRQPPAPPAPPAPRLRRYTRLNTLVAVALLVALVGVLIAGLILVRHPALTPVGGQPAAGALHVYISGQSGVYMLDAAAGAPRWSYTHIHGIVAAAPVAANGVIYFSVSTDGIYALDARSGSLRWHLLLGNNAAGSPLVVANGLVYYSGANDGYLYAFNAATGAVGWRYPLEQPAFLAVADGALSISAIDPVTNETDLYALNASKGTLLWRVPIASQGLPNIMPVVANGVIFFTASGAYVQDGVAGEYSLAYAFRAKDGKRLWRSQNFPLPLTTPPAVANGRLYIGTTKGVYALKASDGSLLWQYDAGGQVYAPLQVADGVIYAGVFRKTASASGVMLALNASDASVRWQTQIAGYVGAYQQYAVLNGTLYVTAGGYAYALNTANGSTRWRSKFSAPLPLGGALTVAP